MVFQGFVGDEILIEWKKKEEKMVGTPMNGRRLSFGFGNGGHDLGPSSTPPSNAGSDYGSF